MLPVRAPQGVRSVVRAGVDVQPTVPQPQPTLDPYAAPESRLVQAGVDAVALPYARPGVRLAARILDNLLYALTSLPAIVAWGALGFPDPETAIGSPVFLGGVMLAVLLSLGLLGLTISMWVSTGQSPGKRALGIRIVREDGAQGDALILVGRRWALFTGLRIALACLGLNSILDLVDALMIFTDRHQTLHDRMAGTVVVDASWEPPELRMPLDF